MLGRLGRARPGQFLLSPEPGPQHSAKEKTESKTERMAEHRRSNKGQWGGVTFPGGFEETKYEPVFLPAAFTVMDMWLLYF